MNYIIDLHSHSLACGHAYSTFQENVLAAYGKGIKYYGFSEHGPAEPGGPHPYFFANLKTLPKSYEDMQILIGCEANIIDLNGGLDLEEDVLASMDYVIASMHPPCVPKTTIKGYTDTVICAMQKPYVKIIGHPDDARMPLEYERVVKAAKEYNVLLEVNNSSLHPNSFRLGARENVLQYLELCKQYEVSVILGSDSHFSSQIGDFFFAEEALSAVNFPKELVVNDDIEKLNKFIFR